MDAKLRKLQKRLGVTDELVYGMIRTLIKAGYGQSCWAFIAQSGQTYSFAFHELEARYSQKHGWKKRKKESMEDIPF